MQFFSATTPLTSGSSWASDTAGNVPGHAILANGANSLRGTVFADQAGTIYIEQSSDGTHWDASTSYAITASDGKGFVEDVVAPFIRLRYTNGGTNQGAFRLYARLHSDDQSNG